MAGYFCKEHQAYGKSIYGSMGYYDDLMEGCAMSYYEKAFYALMKSEGLPLPICEYQAINGRKWRCDFVWLTDFEHGEDHRPDGVVVEVEGGIWSRGRHVRGSGFLRDIEKYNELALANYLLIRIAKEHLDSGQALNWVKRGLAIIGKI